MLKILSIIALSFILFSCNTFKIAERHLDKKMDKSDLTKSIWNNSQVGDTVEYWDNKKMDKPVMILVHGFGASTKYQWSKQVKVLTDDYRLILPNLYQFGNTKPGSEKFGVDDQVDLVHSLIEHLGLKEYSLLGASYGGLISMELANEYKSEVNRLIILDAPVKFFDSTDVTKVTSYFDASSIEELFVPEKPEGLKKLLFLATGKKSHLPNGAFNEFHKEAYLKNLKEMRGLITHMMKRLEEYQNHEYNLDMPTLLIWGEGDKVIPVDRGQKLKEYLGYNASFYVIENSAHMPNMTKHKKFNSLLLEFLNREI
ncbi:MAG: alpha/beta hydrolase [Crocinitomicaceae bacterium]|tara:strand:+ start:223 stop:1161 length:939 start_codon:yes stop_codon:yes gene_type:complete